MTIGIHGGGTHDSEISGSNLTTPRPAEPGRLARDYGALGVMVSVSVGVLLPLFAFAARPLAETYGVTGAARTVLVTAPFVLIALALAVGLSLVFFEGTARQVGWGLLVGVLVPATPVILWFSLFLWPLTLAVIAVVGAGLLLWRFRRSPIVAPSKKEHEGRM